jgi:ribosomal protein S27E
MRNISKQEMFKGLSSSATIVLNEIENKFQSSFETSLFNNSNTISRVDLITNEVLRDTQKGFALLNKNYKIIKEKIVHNSEKEYKEYHKLVKNEYYDILAKTKKIEGSNQYNFIKNLFLLEKANELSKNLVLKKNKLTELNKQISVIANYSLNENNDFLYYFECPECSNKIKLLKKVIANVTCSNCNYKFIINTGVEESSDGLMDKISSFFKL